MKLLYALPEYHRDGFTNAEHLLGLMEEIAKHMEVSLWIEHGEKPANLEYIKDVQKPKNKNLMVRMMETLQNFLRFRMQGGKLIYVHGSYLSAILAAMVMKPTGGKVMVWHCEKFENYGEDIPAGFKNRIKWKILNDWPFRLTLKCIDVLITGTETLKTYYHHQFKIPKKQIRILPNGIELPDRNTPSKESKQKENSNQDEFNILFVHWLSPRKGVHELPEIFNGILKELPHAKITVVGGGPLETWLRKECQKYEWKGSVEICGKIPHGKISTFFRNADLFIMPSRQEGFPRVILESMAYGIPYVATEVGGLKDFIPREHETVLVPPRDPKAFSRKVIDLLKNSQQRKRLRDIGLKHVQNYTPEKIAQHFLELIKTI